METLYQLILILHIVTGAVALVSGGIAFTARKGKGWHTKSGLTFYYSMLLAGFSALCMCLLKFNSFLFIVGLFSLYMTFTGYRSIHRPDTKQTTTRSDKIVWTLTLVGTLLFLLITLSSGGGGMLAVLLVFSIILTGMLLFDFFLFRKKEKLSRSLLLRRHISRMGGAYIAAVTAFFVTNIHMEPVFLPWLLPTAFGTPAIIYFQFKYGSKKERKVVI